MFGMTLPVVKHNYLVMDINDIPRIVKEAFYIAQTGRPGPVLIDIPKNIQLAETPAHFPAGGEPARLQSRRKPIDVAERTGRPDPDGAEAR